jgi:hypothetical protein
MTAERCESDHSGMRRGVVIQFEFELPARRSWTRRQMHQYQLLTAGIGRSVGRSQCSIWACFPRAVPLVIDDRRDLHHVGGLLVV